MPDPTFLKLLEKGELRSARLNENNEWVANEEVKARILEQFKSSSVVQITEHPMPAYLGFVDKDALMPRTFTPQDKVRLVPGGTTVRAGAYVGPGVIIMPPSYINVGAFIDEATLVDSHVLVGSCAQVGKRVHLSTAVQIGGVLEPVGLRPVVVEDDCFIGAGVILTEGVVVRKRAILAPGVVLSAAVPIYDTVHEKTFKLEVPEGAVVVPGSRALSRGAWAKEHGLALNCAVIVKYRDAKTEASVELEAALR